MKKAFKNYNQNLISNFINYLLILNKFILEIFNWLFYNCKVN